MRHFTHEQAIEALPRVRRLVEAMVSAHRARLAVAAELHPLERAVPTNGGGAHPTQVKDAHEAASHHEARLREAVEELQALGVLVKDAEHGIVDFPALHPASRETVLLCWRLGEAGIDYWHGMDEGFAGRKPLPFG